MPVPLSVLDLTVLNADQTSAEALAATTQLARAADALGYHRYWVAEHHNMPSVACTAPTVLMAHLAASTERIRIGSGGVMLPNHAPLVVAEQFALLEALHPGRIDVGIGRAPGTDQATAAAVRRGAATVDDFPRDLLDLMGLLGDRRGTTGLWQHFRATPVPGGTPPLFLLGSSGYSAQLAAQLGLPFAFAHHFDMGGALQAAELYHQLFQPSAVLDRPHMVVTANVLVADTEEDAAWHGRPARITALGRRTGRFVPLPSPAVAADHPDRAEAERMPSGRIVGEPGTVVPALRNLVDRTGADEVMVTVVAFDVEARVRSLELLAAHWSRAEVSSGSR